MVELLDQALASGDYHTTLKLARTLLLQGGHSVADLARINRAVCRAYIGLHMYLEAIPPGELARKLARDCGDWELFATACNELCVAYGYTRQHDAMKACAIDFLLHKPKYRREAYREGLMYINLGTAARRRRDWPEAVQWFSAAKEFFARTGHIRYAILARFHLVLACLRVAPARVPSLLLENRKVLHGMERSDELWRLHWLTVAYWAVHKRQYDRAILLARPAVHLSSQWADGAIEADLLISRCARAIGDNRLAFAHALAARARALQEQMYDLSYEASEILYDLIQEGGSELITSLKPEYEAVGVDLTALIGDPTKRGGEA